MADEAVVSALREADRVELQWFDTVLLAPRLRRVVPGTPVVGVFHDVVSQAHLRRSSTRAVDPLRRLLALVRFVFAVVQERRLVRVLDTAVVLSEKDRVLLGRRGGGADIVVFPAPLDDDDMPPGPPPGRPAVPDVLFVGAFWRPENEDAALWLLGEIWPEVRAAVPGVRLTLAGAGPGPRLEREAGRHRDVELTGYVPSLAAYYRRASVAVCPLRLGAGVKLKGLVAMMWGLPVVATRVGAEGISGPDVFAAVADDAARFAAAVIEVLRDPLRARTVRDRAFRWAHDTYSAAAYLRALERLPCRTGEVRRE
nr:glycosyltransferase [Geodermatophilus normandii]